MESQNAVSYGVMIANYQPEQSGASLDTATHELLASLRQSNPDLKQIGIALRPCCNRKHTTTDSL